MSEEKIEQQIQDKNLTAPRVTPADIDAVIVARTFHIFFNTSLTVCVLTLRNGFLVTGESACASPENFDQEIGEKIAYTNARDKVWALEGYLLRQRLFADDPVQWRHEPVIRNIPEIAELAHEANRKYCETIGDFSQPTWDEAPGWQRESAALGVRFHKENPQASASASHQSWYDQKVLDGWQYGEVKDEANLTHPCMVSFGELPIEQQIKDHIFRSVVHAALAVND